MGLVASSSELSLFDLRRARRASSRTARHPGARQGQGQGRPDGLRRAAPAGARRSGQPGACGERARRAGDRDRGERPPPARATLTVKGSDTIGGELGPALGRAYEAATPGVSVRWEGLGSATAFPGLFDGSAQIGAASRAINAKELGQAKDLGVSLREYILGYDGIAVVVNPTNSVTRLDLDQLAALFTGEVADWSRVGGAPGPVHVVSRPSYSGTHGFFRDHVLRKGKKESQAGFAAGAQFVERSEDVLREVARDPAAIGYVGMGTLRPGMIVVALGATAAGPFPAHGGGGAGG